MDYPENPADASAQRERTWLRLWGWVLYLLGPLTAGITLASQRTILAIAPAWLQPMVQLVVGGFGVWGPLVFGAAGAAYVLAKLQGRKSREEVLAFTILMGVVLVSSYLFLLLAGHFVARLVFNLASA